MAWDMLLVLLSFYLAYHLRYTFNVGGVVPEDFGTPFDTWIPVAGLQSLVLLAIYQLRGLYQVSRAASWFEEVSAIFGGTAVGVMLVFTAVSMARYPASSRLMFIFAWLIVVAVVGLGRLGLRMLRAALHRRGIDLERVLVVGDNHLGHMIMQGLADRSAQGYRVVGFVDEAAHGDFGRFRALGRIENLHDIIAEHEVDQVIIALPSASHRQILTIIEHCRRDGVKFRVVPDLYEMSLNLLDLDTINGIPTIGVKDSALHGWNRFVKRLLDVVVAAGGLLVLSPLLLLIALAIKLDSPGPVLYRQVRLGRHRAPFQVLKFRSMRVGADRELDRLLDRNEVDGPIFKMRNDPRITRVGRWLRRASLDELPQLWNVLRGEMSLVGPRPPIPSEVERYEEWHKKRLEVQPGMTGLWQVSGRSRLSFDEMVTLDIYYIENWSLALDLRILFRTIPAVVTGGGAY